MFRTALMVAATLALAVLCGCRGGSSALTNNGGYHEDADDHEVEIPLSEVPANVKRAALEAVPGLVLEEASREQEDGAIVYDLEGEADGVEYEVEVTASGEVLEVETDDEEGEGEGGNHDDDEDEDDDGEEEDD